jgi:glycosyltransferase involved in cell wall biosynthesis
MNSASRLPDTEEDLSQRVVAMTLSAALRAHCAEDARQQILAHWERYAVQLEETLLEYRNQRAWQFMLLLRKLQIHCTREGWRGLWRALRVVATAPFRGIPALTGYDLVFPAPFEGAPPGLTSPYCQQGQRFALTPRDRWPHRERYDLIILPIVEFEYRFQRPQHLAVQFAARDHRVFWISPAKSLPATSCQPYQAFPIAENLWEVLLGAPRPNLYLDALSPQQANAIADGLRQLCRDWAVGDLCIVLQLPFWRQIGLALRDRPGATLVYDCMDEWNSFPRLGPFTRTEQDVLVHEADVLAVTAKALEERFLGQGLRPVLVRNAGAVELFAQASPDPGLANLPKPVIGYLGAIAEWLDFDLLERAALLRPGYSFVLIGGFDRERVVRGERISRLKALPNVSLLGYRPYTEIPASLASFDVCVIPFLVNEVTRATDPVKLYEYFSQGKPVVATPMDELAPYTKDQCGVPLVYSGQDPEDFAAKLDAALAEDSASLSSRRRAVAAANTWSARYETLDRAIRMARKARLSPRA